jgi:thymidylate kinase
MKMIVLTGPDACGKDTQTEMLSESLKNRDLKVQSLSIWNSLQEFHGVADPKILQKIVETFLLKFSGEARSLFLASCLQNSLKMIKPDSDFVIFNGYHYKYWASELTYGVNPTLWEQKLAPLFPKPDLVVFLDVPPSISLERREVWSAYEQGQAQGTGRFDLKSFQEKNYDTFRTLMSSVPGTVRLDGSQPKTKIHVDLLERVTQLT